MWSSLSCLILPIRDACCQLNTVRLHHGGCRWRWLGNYFNSGFDLLSYLKTDNTSEFSSLYTTRILPILTTGVSFLRSYKVSNKRSIMGHPRSDLVCPKTVSGWTGYVSVQFKCGYNSLGQFWVGPVLSRVNPSIS